MTENESDETVRLLLPEAVLLLATSHQDVAQADSKAGALRALSESLEIYQRERDAIHKAELLDKEGVFQDPPRAEHHRLREAFFDGRVSSEDLRRVLGQAEALRMMVLRDTVVRYSPDDIPDADINLPPHDDFYGDGD